MLFLQGLETNSSLLSLSLDARSSRLPFSFAVEQLLDHTSCCTATRMFSRCIQIFILLVVYVRNNNDDYYYK